MAEIYRSDIVRVDLDHALLRKHVGAILVTGDKLGNRFGAEVYRDGKPVDVSDCGIVGYFMRPGEDTIILPGATSDSVAYVDLAQACYSKASSFTLTIKISYGGATTALRVIDGYILLTQTDDLIDPGETVPSLDDIFAQIAQMEEVIGRAEQGITLAFAVANDARAAVQELSGVTAPPIIPTATGEVVSVSDSANRPLAGLRLYGMTTQDGTPTPNSPVPLVNVGAGGSIWVKVQGKNLLNYDAWKTVGLQRGTAVWENNGVTMTATGDDCYTNDGLFIDDYPAKIPVVPGESITLSWEADRSYSARIFIFPNGTTDGAVACNNTENRPLVYTATEGVSYVTIRFSAEKAGDVISYRNIMVERGSQRTAFEPYADGGSLTASTPGGFAGIPSGGGMICDYKNYGDGVHIQHVGVLTLNGTENWEAGTTFDGRNNRYMLHVPDKMPELSNDKPSRVLCNAYPTISPNAGYLGTEDYGVQGQNDTQTIIINDARYLNQDLNGFKASLAASPITVMYVLATPIETPIPADELAAYRAMTSQYPNTTVYNDAGAAMHVDYIADTQRYIDQRISALLNA